MTTIERVILPLAAINVCTGIFNALLPKGNLAHSGRRAMGIMALIYSMRLIFDLSGGYF